MTPVVVEGTAIVWKFPIPMPSTTGRSFIDVPAGAELLSVGLQNDEMFVWALTDSFNESKVRCLIVANTGMSIPEFPPEVRFLGTLTTNNGIVWHIWDGDA